MTSAQLTRRLPPILAIPAFLALSACSAGIVPSPSPGFTPAKPGRAATVRSPAFNVIGVDARALTQYLGKPRLDIRDPTARKLQFGNGGCVLDTYLYAKNAKGEPVVTHADARNAQSGAPMPWQDCARALAGR